MKKDTLQTQISDSSQKRLVYALSVQYLLARAVHVVTELNLGKILQSKPQSFEEIKAKIGPINDHYFLRLLKFLAHHFVVDMNEAGEFSANKMTCYLTSDSRDLIISDELWCKQGNLLEYLKSHDDDLEKLFTHPIISNIHRLSLSLEASPEHMIFLYSRFHLISRALHTISQINLIQYLDSDKILNIEKVLTGQDINKQQLNNLMSLLGILKLTKKSHGAYKFSKLLTSVLGDSPETIQPAFCMVDTAWWNSVSQLKHTILTGESAFTKANQIDFFKYLELNPVAQRKFDTGLGCFSKNDDELVAKMFEFSQYQSIVDIGGGHGGLLVEILRHDSLNFHDITLYDQPQVLDNTHPCLLERQSNSHYTRAGGNFFQAENETNLPNEKNLYIIKGVLHDFDDDQCQVILKNIHHAMNDNSRLLVVERSLRADNSLNINYSSDIMMLVLLNGRERSMEEWLMLFRFSGLTCENAASPAIAGDFSLMLCRKDKPLFFSKPSGPIQTESQSNHQSITPH